MDPMPRVAPTPFTHVLVKTRYDSTNPKRSWYWRRESWLNDPIIGAQPPDDVLDGKERYATQRAAMVAGLVAAAKQI